MLGRIIHDTLFMPAFQHLHQLPVLYLVFRWLDVLDEIRDRPFQCLVDLFGILLLQSWKCCYCQVPSLSGFNGHGVILPFTQSQPT